MSRLAYLERNWKALAAAMGAALLVAASLAIGVGGEMAYRAQRVQTLEAQASVLAATVEPALVFQDPQAAQESVQALLADAQIEAAGIYDLRGDVVARVVRSGAQPAAAALGETPPHGFERASVTVPVRHEGGHIGDVYLRTGPETAAALIGRHAGVALLLLVAVVVILALQAVQNALSRAARQTEARAAELARVNLALQEQVERRETAEEALRQAQKMETLGQLTGGIAHDFNNLLQAVQGSLDLIHRKPGDPKVPRWAAAGLEAAERGSRLTAQLLAFSRSQKLQLRRVDLGEVAGRLGQMLPTTLGPGVALSFEVADGPMPVMADATQLELAVLNLCINARDAMPNGGEIQVRATPQHVAGDPELADGDYLLLSVSDNGMGMPEDVRDRAFEPFFTTKGVGKGTGLGLAQVYGIAKQASGVARIESAPGEGATVSILLPRAEEAAAPAGESEPEVDAPVVDGAHILIIDDDAGVRGYIAEALAGLGYAPIEAPDGPAGLAALERETVDLMIIDYAMPGMTGADVATAALASRPDMPILFASGYAETDALEAAVGRPARLLRKPFETRALARSVYEALTA